MMNKYPESINARFRSFSDNGPFAESGSCGAILVKLYFCLLLVLFLTRLENLILLEYDDMTHAAMGVSILRTGDWFTMHEGAQLSWLKPPLYFWIEAVFFKFFGVSEYWARFPSAVMGFLSFVLGYKIVKKIWGDKTAFMALVVFSTSYVFIKYSRRAMLDVPVAFATILGVYALVKAEYEDRKSFYLLYGVSIALGYYMKGIQGLYLLGIAPAYFILSRQFRKVFSLYFAGSVVLSFALIAFWAVPQTLKYGAQFIQSQSGIGPLVSMGIPGQHNPFYGPFTVLLGIYWPWVPFSLFGLWLSLKGLFAPGDNRGYALVFSWFAMILLALSVSSAFYLRYLIPLILPFGIFAALALARLIKDRDMDYARHISAAVFAVLVFIAVCFPVKLDRQGTQYISLYRTLNQVTPPDSTLVLYKEKAYRFNQGLVFYADRVLDKQVMDEAALLAEYSVDPAKKYIIATAGDFNALAGSGKIPGSKFDIVASADNWVLFRIKI